MVPRAATILPLILPQVVYYRERENVNDDRKNTLHFDGGILHLVDHAHEADAGDTHPHHWRILKQLRLLWIDYDSEYPINFGRFSTLSVNSLCPPNPVPTAVAAII